MKFEADYSMGHVIVEQLGNNKSAINNESMIKGEKRILYHGDKVSLLFNSNYTYRLSFITTPSYGIAPNKRPTECLNQDILRKKLRSNLEAKWERWDNSLLVYNSKELIHKEKVNLFLIIVNSNFKLFICVYLY